MHGFFVESPSMHRILSPALHRLWGNDWLFVATCGHLWIPPKQLDPLAINRLYQDHRVLARESVFRAVYEAIEQCSCIWVATDPDDEGEVIAHDLARTVFRSTKNHTVFRLRLWGLDESSIREAFEHVDVIDEEQARLWPPATPGHVRRITDRWLAGGLGTPQNPVGRVLSAYLHAVSVQDILPRSPFVWHQQPMHWGDVLTAHEFHQESLKELEQVAQTLYESGLMSYPRSDSRSRPKGMMHEKMKKMNVHNQGAYHLNDFESQKNHAAHHAIVPTGSMAVLQTCYDRLQRGDDLPLTERMIGVLARTYLGRPPSHALQQKIQGQATPESSLKERWVVRTLLNHQLGRPSTYVGFAQKQAERGLITAQGQLSEEGNSWLKHQPDWLNRSFLKEVEQVWSQSVQRNDRPWQQVQQWVQQIPSEDQALLKACLEGETVKELEGSMSSLHFQQDAHQEPQDLTLEIAPDNDDIDLH